MNVALLSNIYGHGTIISDFGTDLALALERQEFLERLDIITAKGDDESIKFGSRSRIYGLYDPNRPLTYVAIFNWFWSV
jgi:hypothetical protein